MVRFVSMKKKNLRIEATIFFILSLVPSFAKEMKFDSNGNIYYAYGNAKYSDGDFVTSNAFQSIRIFSAIEMDDFAVVEQELSSGIGINSSVKVSAGGGAKIEYTPLIFAITKGKEKIAKKLIEKGASLEKTVVFDSGKQKSVEVHPLTASFAQLSSDEAPVSKDFVMYLIGKLNNLRNDFDTLIGQHYDKKLADLYFSKICDLYPNDENRQLNCLTNIMAGAGFIGILHGDMHNFAHESADCVAHLMSYPFAVEKREVFIQWFKNVYKPYFGSEYAGQREWQRVEAVFKSLEAEKLSTDKKETDNQHSQKIPKGNLIQTENETLKTAERKSESEENTSSATTLSDKKQKPVVTESKTPIEKKSEVVLSKKDAVKIIDASAVSGKFKDNIVIISKISEPTSSIKLSAISNGNSILIGTFALHGFDDSVKFDSSKSLRLAYYQKFQLEPSDGKIYAYKAEKRNDDLIIEVREDGSDLSKPVLPKWNKNTEIFSFDLKSLKNEPDENVKFFCNSVRGVGRIFKLYAYDSEQKNWILYGTVQVKKQRNGEKMGTEKGVRDLDDYRYFAIETENANSYKFTFGEDDDDLFITVNE